MPATRPRGPKPAPASSTQHRVHPACHAADGGLVLGHKSDNVSPGCDFTLIIYAFKLSRNGLSETSSIEGRPFRPGEGSCSGRQCNQIQNRLNPNPFSHVPPRACHERAIHGGYLHVSSILFSTPISVPFSRAAATRSLSFSCLFT